MHIRYYNNLKNCKLSFWVYGPCLLHYDTISPLFILILQWVGWIALLYTTNQLKLSQNKTPGFRGFRHTLLYVFLSIKKIYPFLLIFICLLIKDILYKIFGK